MTAHGHHQKLARLKIVFRKLMHDEMCAPVSGFEFTFANRIRQIKSARLAHALVVVLKARHHPFDVVANAIVVGYQLIPINFRLVSQNCFRQTCDNCRLTQQMLGCRLQTAFGSFYYGHRIFRAYKLRPVRLRVDFRAPEARKNQGLLPGNQVRAIQLDRNVNCQPATPQGVSGVLCVRGRGKKIAA